MTERPSRSGKPAASSPSAGTAPEGERIAKVLSRAGVSSRREAERLIELGQVTVNGKVIDSPALNVTAKDKITVAGQPLKEPEPARLWLYYKPDGLVTSAADEKGRETVFDRLPPDMPRVMSVGRLDLNSEGLLLLTNDGELKRRLELPSTGWLRKYRVRVNGNPTDPDLDPLRKGITVEGERFQPMEVKLDRVQGANAWLTIGLREGKNREIRRAMSAIGLYVNRLIRVSYGPFRLNEMKPGEVEEVRPKVLRDQLGLDAPEGTGRATAKPPRPGGAKARPARPGDGLGRGSRPIGKPAERPFVSRQQTDSAKPAAKTFRSRASADQAASAPRPARSSGPSPSATPRAPASPGGGRPGPAGPRGKKPPSRKG
ncbi:rRNA pseudouridine synthase [Tabrizicola sp. J26]|uniref:pseudouridine synthase n=1 Tax=Alitabrizicola rongguiensis TaxID=2909234 RepID=UPI001F39B44C|nr:pseudouridine synthase [Tabrizicola rongguiensis]MCF1708773.1 rRNA pseudouridine synthase [Tabrizicola rongguiensis]